MQDNHGPERTLFLPLGARIALNLRDIAKNLLERLGHRWMHERRIVTFDVMRFVAVAVHEIRQLRLVDASEHSWTGDLVAIEMENRQHSSIARGIHELVGVPARRECCRLSFSVTNNTTDKQVRIVERGSVCMKQRVAELAPFVNRSRSFGGDVAGNAARIRKLKEETLEPGDVF